MEYSMQTTLSALIKYISDIPLEEDTIIPWSCPVFCFGDPSTSTVATLGLNPSNREFVDDLGNELDGPLRRFHTLNSLGLNEWGEANAQHLQLIVESYYAYFLRNPYDAWFRKLDYIISGTNASYYEFPSTACHLDLIPYATAQKWTALSPSNRSALLGHAGDALGLLLRDCPVELLVLNGTSVVETFQQISGVKLDKEEMNDWSLPRRSTTGVTGFAYKGFVRAILDVELERDVLVLGFNHNIQSSFGVTSEVVAAIQQWVGETAEEVMS
jgi:hypothetical protein